jgi:hypothetical protein
LVREEEVGEEGLEVCARLVRQQRVECELGVVPQAERAEPDERRVDLFALDPPGGTLRNLTLKARYGSVKSSRWCSRGKMRGRGVGARTRCGCAGARAPR